jgi:hypothetical protein
MSEEHDDKVSQPKHEQLPNRWNNSWPHISLAHETHEVHERKSTNKVMKRYSADLRPEIFRVLSRVSWAKDNCDEKQRRDNRRKSADHCCWALGRKRDMIASSTITTNANAPQKM